MISRHDLLFLMVLSHSWLFYLHSWLYFPHQRAELERDDSDREDPEDEKPTVVVLRTGDLTAEEAEKFVNSVPQSKGTGSDTGFC